MSYLYFIMGSVVMSYGAFLFFGDGLNPFGQPAAHRRRHWRLGRRIALAVLLVGIGFAFLDLWADVGPVVSLGIAVIPGAAIIAYAMVHHHRSRSWG